MQRRIIVSAIVFGAIGLLLGSCEKKVQAPGNVFSVSGSVDDVFQNIVKQMQSQGLDMEEFERKDHRLKTTLKKIGMDDLKSYATFVEPIERYKEGRYGYRVQVTESGDNATVKIDPIVEGLYTPRQDENPQMGTVNTWKPGTTTGVLEKMLADTIK